MPDTLRQDFPDTPCSDCGKVGEVYIKHWGPLVPPGAVGYFDEPCLKARREDSDRGLQPRPLGQRFRIIIERHQVDLDPSVDVFHVNVETEGATWPETFGSEKELRAFIRGVRAGCSMLGVHVMDVATPNLYTSVIEPGAVHDPERL